MKKSNQIEGDFGIHRKQGIFLLKGFRSDLAGTQPFRIASAFLTMLAIQFLECDGCRSHDYGERKPCLRPFVKEATQVGAVPRWLVHEIQQAIGLNSAHAAGQ